MLITERIFRRLDEKKEAAFILFSSNSLAKNALLAEMNNIGVDRAPVNEVNNIELVLKMALGDLSNVILTELVVEVYTDGGKYEVKIESNVKEFLMNLYTTTSALRDRFKNTYEPMSTVRDILEYESDVLNGISEVTKRLHEILIADNSTKIMYMERPFHGQEMQIPAIMLPVFPIRQSKIKRPMFLSQESNMYRMCM